MIEPWNPGMGTRGGSLRAWLLVALLMPFTALAPVFAAESPSNLEQLRELALDAVNADRAEHDLEPLRLTDALNAAAQDHAADMLARGYFEHASPEGNTVDDRYAAHGGPAWHVVAENLAQCTGCSEPVTEERIDSLEAGWMNSPGHRRNILTAGLDRFGYGIVVQGEQLYAVQTFAGPGTPAGLAAGAKERQVPSSDAQVLALDVVNAARSERGLSVLKLDEGLASVARRLLPANPDNDFAFQADDLGAAFASDGAQLWSDISASTAGCGGCGTVVTELDVEDFVSGWLDHPGNSRALLSSSMTHLGFSASANGDGRKLAIAIVAQAR